MHFNTVNIIEQCQIFHLIMVKYRWHPFCIINIENLKKKGGKLCH
jgi:hypothetical protein